MSALSAPRSTGAFGPQESKSRVLGVGIRRRHVRGIEMFRVCVRYVYHTDWIDVGLHGRIMGTGRLYWRNVD